MRLSTSSLHRALLLATAALMLPGAAAASVISVNFSGRNPGPGGTDASLIESGASSTGVAGLNGNDIWNDIDTGPSSTNGPGAIPLQNVTGAMGEDATVTVNGSNGHWGLGGNRTTAAEDPTGDLFAGWLEGWDGGANNAFDIDVAGLADDFADGYNVYVYISRAGNGPSNTGQLTVTTGTGSESQNFDTPWHTGTETEGANFLVFRGLSGDTFNISGGGENNNNRIGITGFEIVAIPEPSSLWIVGIAGVLGVLRRRRS